MVLTSEIRKIKQNTRPPAGRRTGVLQPIKKRPGGLGSNAFLNHRFLPFWGIADRNYKDLEKEFFASFNHLSNLYNMPAPFLEGLVFPQNVAEAYEHLREQFKKIDGEMECIIMRDETHKATLTTIKNYHTGQHLHYIPVNPLWQIISSAEQQPLADLLLSVFAYLYQVAGVPYFVGNENYLGSQYEYIKDWISEDEDGDDDFKETQIRELALLGEVGAKVKAVICKPEELALLETRLDTYRKWEHYDLETEALASDVLQLYRDYPERSIFDNIHPELYSDDEDNGRVYADQYVSFFWSFKDTLYDTLFDMINNELQKYGISEEPAVVQIFDSPHSVPLNDLNYEKRFFKLMSQLADLLYPYDYDEHQ